MCVNTAHLHNYHYKCVQKRYIHTHVFCVYVCIHLYTHTHIMYVYTCMRIYSYSLQHYLQQQKTRNQNVYQQKTIIPRDFRRLQKRTRAVHVKKWNILQELLIENTMIQKSILLPLESIQMMAKLATKKKLYIRETPGI